MQSIRTMKYRSVKAENRKSGLIRATAQNSRPREKLNNRTAVAATSFESHNLRVNTYSSTPLNQKVEIVISLPLVKTLRPGIRAISQEISGLRNPLIAE